MSVADWSGSHLKWDRDLRSWKARIGAVFGRRELKESAGYFLDGLRLFPLSSFSKTPVEHL